MKYKRPMSQRGYRCIGRYRSKITGKMVSKPFNSEASFKRAKAGLKSVGIRLMKIGHRSY